MRHSLTVAAQKRVRWVGILLSASIAFAQPSMDFQVLGEHGAWPQILSSIGFQPSQAAAKLVVIRPGTAGGEDWIGRVEKGAFVILEGESPAATLFGFQPTGKRVRVAGIEDARRPGLSIIWEKSIELPQFEIPPDARVFAKERRSGAPVLAGLRRGAGAVLWVIASPGEQGYERFPYLLQAASDLGLETPFRSSRLWAFFDYSYRTRVDIDYFAARWRSSGISAIHVAAWHFYDVDRERDQYLKNLIAACHRNGVLVYAWLELPHVSEKFWNDHPEWREKTAVMQDAHLDWRKLMNLTSRDCFRAVSAGVTSLLGRHDWDGANLGELYFESLEGAANPARFTPMNGDVRAQFLRAKGFDPVELFSTRKDPASLRVFLDFRAELARRMQQDWLVEIESVRRLKPNLDIVLTHVDDRFDTGMRDAIGADVERVLPLLDQHDFTFLIEDPATVWHLGPQRYPEIFRRYRPLTKHAAKLAIDINVVDRYQDVYPTKQQTGSELFQLVNLASRSFARIALYFENSLQAQDLKLLPASAANVNSAEANGSRWSIDSEYGVGVSWRGPVTVDGKLWPVTNGITVWLPPGRHSVEAAAAQPSTRIVDFNGQLSTAELLPSGALRIAYESASRAIAMLDRQPLLFEIDGLPLPPDVIASGTQWALMLPRGKHSVVIQFQPASEDRPPVLSHAAVALRKTNAQPQ